LRRTDRTFDFKTDPMSKMRGPISVGLCGNRLIRRSIPLQTRDNQVSLYRA
jgi:hypothetical protein